MDRRSRRYVPSSEGLEGRQLLSTTPTVPTNAVTVNPASNAPSGTQVDEAAPTEQTIEAKRHHIKNLPYFIGMLNKDGLVPQPTVSNIQNDLYNEVAQLKAANPSLVSAFNLDLRKAEAYEDITPISSQDLSRDFGAVLVSAGVNAQRTANLQSELNQLIQYDSTQVGSTIAATNDYGTVLQLALQSGRPLVYPNVPTLLGTDHNGNDGKIPITYNHSPSLTGTYSIGVNIEIVDVHNKIVLGRGRVDPSTGTYTVKFDERLKAGFYTVRTRVEDSAYISDPSPKFTFEVKPAPAKK